MHNTFAPDGERSAWLMSRGAGKKGGDLRHRISLNTPCYTDDRDLEHCHRKVLLDGDYVHRIGTHAQVKNGTAFMTAGGLTADDIDDITYGDHHYYPSSLKRRAGLTNSWAIALKQARVNLGITGFVPLSKTPGSGDGYRLYLETKRLQGGVVSRFGAKSAPGRIHA